MRKFQPGNRQNNSNALWRERNLRPGTSAYLTPPGGATRREIGKEFASLPKGARLDVKITYDNSADNPRNPASPPKRVYWGEGSNDEMGSMSLTVVAANEAEMPQLQQAYRQHVRSALMSREGLSSLQRRTNLADQQ
jgi:hypothetical protein